MTENFIEKELNEAWDPKEVAKQDAEFAWETGHPMDPDEWETSDKNNIMTEYDFTEEQAEIYREGYWDYYYICMAGDPYNDDDLDENLTETKATGARGRYQVEVFDEGDWHKLNSWSTIEKATKAGEAAVEAVYQDYRIIDKETNNEVELQEKLHKPTIDTLRDDLRELAKKADAEITKSGIECMVAAKDGYVIAIQAVDPTKMKQVDEIVTKVAEDFDFVPDIERKEKPNGTVHLYRFKKVQKLAIKENVIEEESDGDIPYTKEEVEAELKRETNNWETKEDTIRYGFQSEKDFAMEILSQHYECEYKGKEGSDYVIHFWKQNLNESKSVNECFELDLDTDLTDCNQELEEAMDLHDKITEVVDYLMSLKVDDILRGGSFGKDFNNSGTYFFCRENDDDSKTFGVATLGADGKVIAEQTLKDSGVASRNESRFIDKIASVQDKVVEYIENTSSMKESILKENTQRYSFDTSAKKAEKIKLQLKKKNIKCIIVDYQTSGKYFDYGDEDEELDGDVNYALVIVGVDYDDIDKEIEELTDNYPSIYIYDTIDPDCSDLPNYVYEVYNRNSDCFTTNNTIEAINKAIDFLQLTNESLIEAKNTSKEHNNVIRIINNLLYAYSSDTHYGKSVSYNKLLKDKYDAKNDSGEFLVNMSFRPNPKVSINYKEGEAEKILFDSVNLFKDALEGELEELGFTNYIIETLQDTLHVTKNNGNNPVVAKFKGSVLSANIHVRILVDYFKDLEEHFAVDTHDQLDKEEVKPVVELKPVNESAANLSLSDRLRRRNAGEPVEPIKHAAEPKESPNITSKEPLSKRLKSKLKEEKATKKFETGSEKTFAEESEEWAQLQKAADKLTDLSVKNYKYFVGNTYLDFGSGWQWTTILAKKPNEVEYQVLSPLAWRNIMNAHTEEELDSAIDSLRSDEYFSDKVKEPTVESTERDIFEYLNSIEE